MITYGAKRCWIVKHGVAKSGINTNYQIFDNHIFDNCRKTLDADVVRQVYRRFNGVTAYLQRVMNVLFMNTPKGERCTENLIEDAIDFIVNLNSEHYEMLFSQMSEKQRVTFLAIAMEGRAKNISSGQFVRKYHLLSSSSVVSAVKGLLEKDFITYNQNEYYVYDYFFPIWMNKRGYINLNYS